MKHIISCRRSELISDVPKVRLNPLRNNKSDTTLVLLHAENTTGISSFTSNPKLTK